MTSLLGQKMMHLEKLDLETSYLEIGGFAELLKLSNILQQAKKWYDLSLKGRKEVPLEYS